ncbi:RHS repeat domain-containing protein [Myroides odoratus]|uniref:RHS repeat domain-containing protein n=1 Tax=Myroides odoratus TaxID=256 RepID=UPI0039B10C55
MFLCIYVFGCIVKEVVFAGGKINYLYTATGEKIQKKVIQGSTTVVTDYLDGFQYVKGVLSFFPTAEGYFNAETNGYVYQYSDHLGNVRLSYSDTNKNDKIDVGEIIEENNYYPFGLTHKGYNEKNNTIAANYKYQYNAKELQEELGFNVYDYGARNYDAALGRWMNVDPLAEQAVSWTPYRYGFNNPMLFTDPTGMLETEYKDENGQTLLNTKDGSDDIVTVSNAKRKDFKHYNASYQSGNKSLYDSQEWNDNMKADLLGFSTTNEMNATLGGFTTQWSRQNAINYLQNPTLANAMAMSASESLSQWTDPEKLIMGASILVGGIAGGGRTSSKATTQYTKSNLKLGQKQLNMYKSELETMQRFKGVQWKTVLDTY